MNVSFVTLPETYLSKLRGVNQTCIVFCPNNVDSLPELMSTNCPNRVSTIIGSGVWFTTESGVRPGSILSPILFIMYMDLVIKEVHQNNPDNDFVLA